MVRRDKDPEELKPKTKKLKEYYEKNPEKHKDVNKKKNEYYQKTKDKQSRSKQVKTKGQKEKLYKIFGEKCESCGEEYNSHAKMTNLQFDHKRYLRGKTTHVEVWRQVKHLVDTGEDPKTRFALLCYTCHAIVTALRQDKKKSIAGLEYCKREEIIK